MKSIFTGKSIKPAIQDLKEVLGKTFPIWKKFEDFIKQINPHVTADWHYSGDKFGWSYRIKDNKRVVLYLLPRHKFSKQLLCSGRKQQTRSWPANFLRI